MGGCVCCGTVSGVEGGELSEDSESDGLADCAWFGSRMLADLLVFCPKARASHTRSAACEGALDLSAIEIYYYRWFV